MLSNDKPVPLKLIDDEDAETAEPVIRIDNETTVGRQKVDTVIRLAPQIGDLDSSENFDRLKQDDVELRTHQPGIDVLIETESYDPDYFEKRWEETVVGRPLIAWGWFALAGLIVFGAVVWSLLRVKEGDAQIAKINREIIVALKEEAKEQADAEALVNRINLALSNYFKVTGVEELIKQVRHPERVGPLMREYYKGKPVFQGVVKSVKLLQPLTLGNRGDFWRASVVISNGIAKSLVIEILASGEPKIDWETLVYYQPMPWDDFVSKRPKGTPMDFRVIVWEDSFYSHEFANSAQWTSFRLTALGSEETLFGYVPVGSELMKEIKELIRQNSGDSDNLILRLSIPEGIQSHRGVIIEKLISPRWLYLDSPDTGS